MIFVGPTVCPQYYAAAIKCVTTKRYLAALPYLRTQDVTTVHLFTVRVWGADINLFSAAPSAVTWGILILRRAVPVVLL